MTKPPKTRKYPTLDVYFHMTNHYRKLKNVKSTIDTRLFKGTQKCRSRAQSVTPINSQKCGTNEFCCNPPVTSFGKRNECRSASLPPRPPTRRCVFDMPEDVEVPIRCSASKSPSQTKFQTAKLVKQQTIPIKDEPQFALAKNDNVPEKIPVSPENNVPVKEPPIPAPRTQKPLPLLKSAPLQSIKDHEYLQFSLRITEDIIRNNLYTNKEMKRVFNSHIEANRGRLDMQKMKEHVEKLCKELNIPLEETNQDVSSSVEDLKKTQENLQSSLICICGPKRINLHKSGDDNNRKCECNDTRCAPLHCIQHPPINTEFKSVSLGCVTEVTEPSSSFATITSLSEKVSTLSVDSNNKEDKTESSGEAVVSVFHAKFDSVESKPPEEKQKKVNVTSLFSFEPKGAPKPEETCAERKTLPPAAETCAESETESQIFFSNSDEEYVLISGPIYVPKSVLQYPKNLEKPATLKPPPPITYSFLHTQAEAVKHEVSYSSNYPYSGFEDVLLGTSLLVDSQDFTEPPKIFQLKNIKDVDVDSFQSTDPFLSIESVLVNRTEYDETPQRDFGHPGYNAVNKTKETLIASDLKSKDTTKSEDEAKSPSQCDYFSNGKRKREDSESPPKQDLLLGEEYKLSPAEAPYDSCLPYPLNLFYPTIATQTASSDFIAAEHLLEVSKKASEIVPLEILSEDIGKAPEESLKIVTDEYQSKASADKSSSKRSSKIPSLIIFTDEYQSLPEEVVDDKAVSERLSKSSSKGSPTKIMTEESLSKPAEVAEEKTTSENASKSSSKGTLTKIMTEESLSKPAEVAEEKATSENSSKSSSKGSLTKIMTEESLSKPAEVAEEKTASENSSKSSSKGSLTKIMTEESLSTPAEVAEETTTSENSSKSSSEGSPTKIMTEESLSKPAEVAEEKATSEKSSKSSSEGSPTKIMTEESLSKPAEVAEEKATSEKSSKSSSKGSLTKIMTEESLSKAAEVAEEKTTSENSSKNSSKGSIKIISDEYLLKSASRSSSANLHKSSEESAIRIIVTVPKSIAEETTASESSSEKIEESPELKPVVEETATGKNSSESIKPIVAMKPSSSKDLISIGLSTEIKDASIKSSSENSEESTSSSIQSVEYSDVQSVPAQSISFRLGSSSPVFQKPANGHGATKKVPNEEEVLEKKFESSLHALKPTESRGGNRKVPKREDGSFNDRDFAPENKEDDLKEVSLETASKSNDITFAELCRKLDAKHSSTPSKSQLMYVQEVVNELDKYRKPESEPRKKSSLKQLAVTATSSAISAKIDTESVINTELKPSVASLLRPSTLPPPLTEQENLVDDDDETSRFCGFLRKKKRKDTRTPPAAPGISDKEMDRRDSTRKRSIRFDDPGVYHQFQKQYPKQLETTPKQ